MTLTLAAALSLTGGWGAGLPTSEPASDAAAAAGPTGLIAFSSTRRTATIPEADGEIYTIRPDGSRLTQLTFNDVPDEPPAWSPDGKRIAFTSSRNNDREIFTMKANGSDQTNRTPQRGEEGQPAWQPKPR